MTRSHKQYLAILGASLTWGGCMIEARGNMGDSSPSVSLCHSEQLMTDVWMVAGGRP